MAKLPSERSFGFLFSTVFAALGIHEYWSNGWDMQKGWDSQTCIPWLIIGLTLGLIAVLAPRLLGPFNRAWFRLGELLGKIVSPIVLGVIFFVLLVPIAFITRLFGRDELRLKQRETDTSYWIERTQSGFTSDSFKNQF
ncbi:hypothetical protein F6R98_05280 [Candidatus Methylospira mobilis]|uniref:SxtJ n=1 Tax=Candidatus Methylospira mobilis TaxID=1808979 RepID=A0A5Q0BG57_9GAMM|nr:SxtJ family membrane protein [Candidatus Methylospira mobilis]QFY42112.1 hypothetical protein F6R98_05280 [Candidatus Methylospira mobilis]WNV03124.1 SxtJ family membrane protein [Candidatus Methylospira mobilis]